MKEYTVDVELRMSGPAKGAKAAIIGLRQLSASYLARSGSIGKQWAADLFALRTSPGQGKELIS